MECWERASDNIEFAHNLSLELGANVLFYYDPKREKVWQEQPDWSATKTKVDYHDPLRGKDNVKHDAVYVHSIVSHALVQMINRKDYCGFSVTRGMGIMSQRVVETRPISDIVVRDVKSKNDNYSLALQLEGVIGWIKRWGKGLHMIVVLFNYDNDNDVRGAGILNRTLSLSELFSDRGIEVCQLPPASLTDDLHATKLAEATAKIDVFRQIHSHLREAAKLIGATVRSAAGTKRSRSQHEEESDAESESESDADESGTTTDVRVLEMLTTALNSTCDEPSSNAATETKKLRPSLDDRDAEERAVIVAEIQSTIDDKKLPAAVREQLRKAFVMRHDIQHWALVVLRCHASSYRDRSGAMTPDQEREAVAELEKFVANRELFAR